MYVVRMYLYCTFYAYKFKKNMIWWFSINIRYGPREVTKKEEFSMKGQLTCEFKFATFSCRVRRQYQQDNEERDYSCQLQDALEPAVRMVSLSQYHAYTLLIILLNTVGIMVHLSLSLILLICYFRINSPKLKWMYMWLCYKMTALVSISLCCWWKKNY